MAIVPVTHQVNTNTGYQGTKEVMTPNTIMVTLLAQMATFLPYLRVVNHVTLITIEGAVGVIISTIGDAKHHD